MCAEDIGMPLSMEPNFEDSSCKMIWGKQPLPLEEDEAMAVPCKASECPVFRSLGEECYH